MTIAKAPRPAFQAVELDPVDRRLEAKAAEKGIPTLVVPKPVGEAATKEEKGPETENTVDRKTRKVPASEPAKAAPRMFSLTVEVPDYVWIALKTRAAQDMSSLRHFTLKAFRAQGIEIRDEDMIEDGRRLRGGKGKKQMRKRASEQAGN